MLIPTNAKHSILQNLTDMLNYSVLIPDFPLGMNLGSNMEIWDYTWIFLVIGYVLGAYHVRPNETYLINMEL